MSLLEKWIHKIADRQKSRSCPIGKVKDCKTDEVLWYCNNFYISAFEGNMQIKQWKNNPKYSEDITRDIGIAFENYIRPAEKMIEQTAEEILNTDKWFDISTQFIQGEIFMALALDEYIKSDGANRYKMLDGVKFGYYKVKNTSEKYIR
jgi:hypothetical protein